MIKRVLSDESGRVLVLTLIILGVGILVLPAFLSHSSTNLFVAQSTEESLKEQYAADSGVEYALWKLQTRVLSGTAAYGSNGKEVEVTWGEHIAPVYVITSTATSDDGASTTVVSHISLNMLDYLWLLDNAVTSLGDVTLKPGTHISGTVQYAGDLDNKGTIDPEEPAGPTEGLDENWPPTEDIASFFWNDVEHLEGEAYGPGNVKIDLKDYPSGLGPLLYVDDGDVDTLTIYNTGPAITVQLLGTIYVVGDLDFDSLGESHAYTIDLNGNTIYCTEDVWFSSNHVSITGSGCIIAEGFVDFQPGMSSNPDDFVFVMSLTDYVHFQPNGAFYGSVAGDVWVDMWPGGDLIWTGWRGRDINFPDGSTGHVQIRTYNLYP